MDELLTQKYNVLINDYKPNMAWLRNLVLARVGRHPTSVRPDAVYFLIVNFDEMIVTPYARSLRLRQSLSPTWPQYKNYSIENLKPRVENALNILFTDLLDVNEVSAHQVVRAIDANWNKLAELFGWG